MTLSAGSFVPEAVELSVGESSTTALGRGCPWASDTSTFTTAARVQSQQSASEVHRPRQNFVVMGVKARRNWLLSPWHCWVAPEKIRRPHAPVFLRIFWHPLALGTV